LGGGGFFSSPSCSLSLGGGRFFVFEGGGGGGRPKDRGHPLATRQRERAAGQLKRSRPGQVIVQDEAWLETRRSRNSRIRAVGQLVRLRQYCGVYPGRHSRPRIASGFEFFAGHRGPSVANKQSASCLVRIWYFSTSSRPRPASLGTASRKETRRRAWRNNCSGWRWKSRQKTPSAATCPCASAASGPPGRGNFRADALRHVDAG